MERCHGRSKELLRRFHEGRYPRRHTKTMSVPSRLTSPHAPFFELQMAYGLDAEYQGKMCFIWDETIVVRKH